jgi:hypothetical protein
MITITRSKAWGLGVLICSPGDRVEIEAIYLWNGSVYDAHVWLKCQTETHFNQHKAAINALRIYLWLSDAVGYTPD